MKLFNEFILHAIVYDLAEMRLETMAKMVEIIERYHKNIFSISNHKLLCFTRGLHSVK